MDDPTPWNQGHPEQAGQFPPVHPIDAPEDRPGVPMEAEPSVAPGAHWTEPARQPGADQAPHRGELKRATPVFGTAQPLHGLSGALRTNAYSIPEHFARHWLLLLVADRVDVLEGRLGSAMAAPLERAGMMDGARHVRGNLIPVVAGFVVGAWAVGRAFSSAGRLLKKSSGSRTRRLLKESSGSRCAATAPDPRRSDDAIAVATARSSNDGDGAVAAQPTTVAHTLAARWRAQGGCAVDPSSLLLTVATATPRRRSSPERAQAPCARPAGLLQQPSRKPSS